MARRHATFALVGTGNRLVFAGLAGAIAAFAVLAVLRIVSPPPPDPVPHKDPAAKPLPSPIETAPPPPQPAPPPPAPSPSVSADCVAFASDYSAAMRATKYECVRAILMPRLNLGTITSPEARYLKAACNALGDKTCETRAAGKI